jgi:hypothetical protein
MSGSQFHVSSSSRIVQNPEAMSHQFLSFSCTLLTFFQFTTTHSHSNHHQSFSHYYSFKHNFSSQTISHFASSLKSILTIVRFLCARTHTHRHKHTHTRTHTLTHTDTNSYTHSVCFKRFRHIRIPQNLFKEVQFSHCLISEICFFHSYHARVWKFRRKKMRLFCKNLVQNLSNTLTVGLYS